MFYDLSKFDEITRYRLINMFMFSLLSYLMAPVIINLKGELLASYVISVLMVFEILSVKLNKYVVKINMSDLYKMGTMVHVLFTVVPLIYFYDQLLMIILESFVGILEVIVFSSYSIQLNNYLAKYYPGSMNNYQLDRNSLIADGSIIGLSVAAILTYFFSLGINIIVFFVLSSLFSMYLISNWNFYAKIKQDFN